jgi:hypothetical protein
MMKDEDCDGEAGGSSCDQQAIRSSGLVLRIFVEPESLERSAAPIPMVWNPQPDTAFDYDPYGVRPLPEDIAFDEPAMTIVWESPVCDPPTGICHPGHCSCGADLPPGKWLDHEPAGNVEDATRYPMADGDADESPTP